MQRNISLSPRIEERRNKNNVQIEVVEFNLNQIKIHFNDNISNIEQNFKIVDKLISLNEIDKSKDILRSQIVFLESALDFYLHELSKCGMIKIFNGDWPKTERYNNLKVEMKLIDAAIKNPESCDWLLSYINNKNKREVYISLESMREQLNLLGIEFESVVKNAFSDKSNAREFSSNGKQIIKDLFDRRNEIAHQSDRNHFNSEQNEITKKYVLENIEYVKRLVEAIHDIAISKTND